MGSNFQTVSRESRKGDRRTRESRGRGGNGAAEDGLGGEPGSVAQSSLVDEPFPFTPRSSSPSRADSYSVIGGESTENAP
jgi:hypothetical protein